MTEQESRHLRHDLRNTLNAVLLMSGLVLHELDKRDLEAARESARELEAYVRRETARITTALDADRERSIRGRPAMTTV